MSSGLAVTDIKTGQRHPDAARRGEHYFAGPVGYCGGPGSRRAFVASGGGDVVTVVDLERLADWLEKADPAAKRRRFTTVAGTQYVTARIPTSAIRASLRSVRTAARCLLRNGWRTASWWWTRKSGRAGPDRAGRRRIE